MRWTGMIFVLSLTGCFSDLKPDTDRACKISSDCDAARVCRDDHCVPVACPPTCRSDELCTAGQCASAGRPAPGHALASGGGVSRSAQSIHVGLTGQGRFVGGSQSPTSRHQGGATVVLEGQR